MSKNIEQIEDTEGEFYYESSYAGPVRMIQDNAMSDSVPNGVKKNLTFQQALSIHLRSLQLSREGGLHPHLITAKEKARQIEACYRQR